MDGIGGVEIDPRDVIVGLKTVATDQASNKKSWMQKSIQRYQIGSCRMSQKQRFIGLLETLEKDPNDEEDDPRELGRPVNRIC